MEEVPQVQEQVSAITPYLINDEMAYHGALCETLKILPSASPLSVSEASSSCLDANLKQVYKSRCKALHLGWNSCVHQDSPGADYLKTALQKKNYELNMSQQRALAPKAAASIQGCFSKRVASRSRELIIPLYSILMRPYADYCVQYKKDTDILEHNRRRNFTAVFQYLMGGYRVDGARFFSDVHSKSTRGNRRKLQKVLAEFFKTRSNTLLHEYFRYTTATTQYQQDDRNWTSVADSSCEERQNRACGASQRRSQQVAPRGWVTPALTDVQKQRQQLTYTTLLSTGNQQKWKRL
ncbi:hypothetical protein QYF61_019663 [Mycteria americana]|uniref:Uncharacterized protein n=1 Tax=Mycteria americana TaxID=33587 RepID=A0AAN7PEA9_MYCAM|nr:hypothetical protein QYF61_019663 [Mycteria americana]